MTMGERPVVHVVHCVDTEGPLREGLEATFDRIEEVFGLRFAPSAETLGRLQRREIDVGPQGEELARMISPKLLDYNDTWEKIEGMLSRVMSPAFRATMPDSFGRPWVYNWHCVDHVEYVENPRGRDLGYHRVFDRYRARLAGGAGGGDGLHFHYHPMPFNRHAHCCGSHYFANGDTLFQILARRVIERGWFPCVNRPGFHLERPDSHWFLEQFIPFDYANQAGSFDTDHQRDTHNGRFGDWTRAPATWTPYHPSHDDYQTPGLCRRWILRCMSVGTRFRLLSEEHVRQAFREAEEGRPVVLSITNHDFREMGDDVDGVRTLLHRVAAAYPGVAFRYGEAREAARLALGIEAGRPLTLGVSLEGNCLRVRSDRATFGPQPFLAVSTRGGRFFHDNMDFLTPRRAWTYSFDMHTVPLEEVDRVGVAACDEAGNVSVAVLRPATGEVRTSGY